MPLCNSEGGGPEFDAGLPCAAVHHVGAALVYQPRPPTALLRLLGLQRAPRMAHTPLSAEELRTVGQRVPVR